MPSPSATAPEAPKVAGCKSEVAEGKVLYYAEEGNTYGLEAGEVFGEFVPNVNMVTEGENNVEGGWALSAKAAHALLQQASTETGEDVTKTKIVLPLDISDLEKNDDGIDIYRVSAFRGDKDLGFHALLLDFGNSKLTLVNGIDNGDKDTTMGSSAEPIELTFLKSNGEKVIFRKAVGYTFTPLDAHLMYYSDSFSTNGFPGSFFFGDAVTTIDSPLIVSLPKNVDTDFDDIFTFQGLPVFLLANKTN